MNASYVPFASLPGGWIVAIVAILLGAAVFSFDWNDHSNQHNDNNDSL